MLTTKLTHNWHDAGVFGRQSNFRIDGLGCRALSNIIEALERAADAETRPESVEEADFRDSAYHMASFLRRERDRITAESRSEVK